MCQCFWLIYLHLNGSTLQKSEQSSHLDIILADWAVFMAGYDILLHGSPDGWRDLRTSDGNPHQGLTTLWNMINTTCQLSCGMLLSLKGDSQPGVIIHLLAVFKFLNHKLPENSDMRKISVLVIKKVHSPGSSRGNALLQQQRKVKCEWLFVYILCA